MRTSTRKIQLLVGIAIALSAALAPAEPAFAVAPPTHISVHFADSGATIEWTMAPGIEGYGITIRELGSHRSYGEEQVLGDRWTAPYKDFPGYGTYKDGYAYRVCSITRSGRHACTSIKDGFSVDSSGDGVSTSNPHKAANKASACLAAGEKAGLVTATGTGIVGAVVSWIPGVDAIAAADVAVGAAKVGAATFVACLSDW